VAGWLGVEVGGGASADPAITEGSAVEGEGEGEGEGRGCTFGVGMSDPGRKTRRGGGSSSRGKELGMWARERGMRGGCWAEAAARMAAGIGAGREWLLGGMAARDGGGCGGGCAHGGGLLRAWRWGLGGGGAARGGGGGAGGGGGGGGGPRGRLRAWPGARGDGCGCGCGRGGNRTVSDGGGVGNRTIEMDTEAWLC
jgi:hypothetical protein